MSQLAINFAPPPRVEATAPELEATHEARFARFHSDNPHVYRRLVDLARSAKARGKRVGIGMLFEVLRYEFVIETSSDDGFRLNNNHRAFYARAIMANEPDLDGFFETRAQNDEAP